MRHRNLGDGDSVFPLGSEQAVHGTKKNEIDEAMTRRSANTNGALDRMIGGRIRMLRKMRSMSQPELAAAIGLSFQQVQRYETGESSLSVALLSKVAQALSVGPTDLIGAVLQSPAAGADVFSELKAPGAMDLLAAYAALDPKGQGHILAVAQAMAKSDPTQKKLP
jgi:transcriptional regulator with XRE-family HTH domain